VNKRAITWLLAAFLALTANAAVPVARAGRDEANSAIVWIAQERSERRFLLPSRAVSAQPALPFYYQPPTKARHFAASLYQRPPPFLR